MILASVARSENYARLIVLIHSSKRNLPFVILLVILIICGNIMDDKFHETGIDSFSHGSFMYFIQYLSWLWPSAKWKKNEREKKRKRKKNKKKKKKERKSRKKKKPQADIDSHVSCKISITCLYYLLLASFDKLFTFYII